MAEDLDVLTRSPLRSVWSLPDRVAIDEAGGPQVVRVSPTRLLANLRDIGIPGTETDTALTVLRRRRDIHFDFDGPFVEFAAAADLEVAVGTLAERGVATTPPALHIIVRRAAAGWWDVAVPRAQASVVLAAHALRHAAKVTGSYDSTAVHAQLTDSEWAALLTYLANPGTDQLPVEVEVDERAGLGAPAPPVTFAREGPWRITADLAGHPLLPRIADIAGEWVQRGRHRTPRAPISPAGLLSTHADNIGEVLAALRAASIEVSPHPPPPTTSLTPRRAPGWTRPTAAGRLHTYQKRAATFAARHNLNALICDQMGLGKTAEAVAAAEASGVSHTLIVAPASARMVWDAEIAAWGSGGRVHHVTDTLTPAIPDDARWVVVTWDQMIVRAQKLSLPPHPDRARSAEIVWRSEEVDEATIAERLARPESIPAKVTVSRPLAPETISALPETLRVGAERINTRLASPLTAELLRWGPDLVVADECHRALHRDTKRSQALDALASAAWPTGERHLLLLSGTPARNSASEPEALLRLLDPGIARPDRKLSKAEIGAYLAAVMIRRVAEDVFDELPEVVRQRWPLPPTDFSAEQARRYAHYAETRDAEHTLWSKAYDSSRAKTEAGRRAEADQETLGLHSAARRLLGVAKAHEPALTDLICEAVAEHGGGGVVVFAHHLEAISTLVSTLVARKLRVGTIAGATSAHERARLAKAFAGGSYDVLVCGISVAEAYSLPSARVGIFVELDPVPTAMQQAERRLIRPAAERHPVHMIYVVSLVDDSMDPETLRTADAKLADIAGVVPRAGDLAATPDVPPPPPPPLPNAPWGLRPDGRPRKRPAGPGRPPLAPEERAARRRESARRWREAHRGIYADYSREYRQRRRAEAGGDSPL